MVNQGPKGSANPSYLYLVSIPVLVIGYLDHDLTGALIAGQVGSCVNERVLESTMIVFCPEQTVCGRSSDNEATNVTAGVSIGLAFIANDGGKDKTSCIR
jgi:hypothetical protein